MAATRNVAAQHRYLLIRPPQMVDHEKTKLDLVRKMSIEEALFCEKSRVGCLYRSHAVAVDVMAHRCFIAQSYVIISVAKLVYFVFLLVSFSQWDVQMN